MKPTLQSRDETLAWYAVRYQAPASYGNPAMRRVAKVLAALDDERDLRRQFYARRSGANAILSWERL